MHPRGGLDLGWHPWGLAALHKFGVKLPLLGHRAALPEDKSCSTA